MVKGGARLRNNRKIKTGVPF